MRSRTCRQVKREEVAVRRNPMDAALIQPQGSRSSHLERHGQQVLSNSCSKSLSGSTELQAFRSKGQEEKGGKSGKEIGMMRGRQMSGMKALRWILLWTLICVRMQMVEVEEEEEIPVRREMERMLETALVSAWETWQDGGGWTSVIEEGQHGNIGKNKTAREQTQRR